MSEAERVKGASGKVSQRPDHKARDAVGRAGRMVNTPKTAGHVPGHKPGARSASCTAVNPKIHLETTRKAAEHHEGCLTTARAVHPSVCDSPCHAGRPSARRQMSGLTMACMPSHSRRGCCFATLQGVRTPATHYQTLPCATEACGSLWGRYFVRDEVACLGLHAPSVDGIYSAAAPDLPPSCPVVGRMLLIAPGPVFYHQKPPSGLHGTRVVPYYVLWPWGAIA